VTGAGWDRDVRDGRTAALEWMLGCSTAGLERMLGCSTTKQTAKLGEQLAQPRPI